MKKIVPLLLVLLVSCSLFLIPCGAATATRSYLNYNWTTSANVSVTSYESGENYDLTFTNQGFRNWSASYGGTYSGYAIRAGMNDIIEDLTVSFSALQMYTGSPDNPMDYAGENSFHFYSYIYGLNSANRPESYTATLRFSYYDSVAGARWYNELGSVYVNHVIDIGNASSFDILFDTWGSGLYVDQEHLVDVTLSLTLRWNSDSLAEGTAFYISFAEQSYMEAWDESWDTKLPPSTFNPPQTINPDWSQALGDLTLPDFTYSVSDDGRQFFTQLWSLDMVVKLGIPIILLALLGVTAKIILYKR